ncbi:MAG: pilin [Minisyncoccia bacterium]|jgi:hypothetical protein
MSKKIIGALYVSVLGLFSFANSASAALFDIWRGTGTNGQTCNVSSRGCSLCDGLTVAINIVNDLTTFAVIATVGMVVYGAVRMMLSGGSEEMFKEAKGIITKAVIGLVIVLCSWLIINTLIHLILGRVDFPWNNVQCQNP